MFYDLPYISKQGIKRLFKDLPNKEAPGRNGHMISPRAGKARAALTISPNTQQLRDGLKHLQGEMDRKTITQMITKYKCIPEQYYKDPSKYIGPDDITTWCQKNCGWGEHLDTTNKPVVYPTNVP